MPGLLCTIDLVLCGELQEDTRVMIRHLSKRKSGLKVKADKSEEMVLGDEGLVCEICVDGNLNTWDMC